MTSKINVLLTATLVIGLVIFVLGRGGFMGEIAGDNFVPLSMFIGTYHIQDGVTGLPIEGATFYYVYNGGSGVHPGDTYVSDGMGNVAVYANEDFQSFYSWIASKSGYEDATGFNSQPPTTISLQPYNPATTPTPSPTPTPYVPPTYYTVSISVYPYNSGSVTVNPVSSQYLSGTAITLTPSAYSGYKFDHWQETYPSYGALYSNPLSFNIDNNYVFTAIFVVYTPPTPTPSPTAQPTQNPFASPTPYVPPTPTPVASATLVPSPSATLQPPASLPPESSPTPISAVNGVSADKINSAAQLIGLAIAVTSGIAFVPANHLFTSKKKR